MPVGPIEAHGLAKSERRPSFQGLRIFFGHALKTVKGYPDITHHTFPFPPGQYFAYVKSITLEATKQAITDLAPDEKARLAAWLLQRDPDFLSLDKHYKIG